MDESVRVAATGWAPVVGGAILAGYGVRRGSWAGLALAAVGGAAVVYGLRTLTGPRYPWRSMPGKARRILNAVGAGVNAGTHDHVAQAAKEERAPAGTHVADVDDMVDDALDDTFPASDPPSYTAR